MGMGPGCHGWSLYIGTRGHAGWAQSLLQPHILIWTWLSRAPGAGPNVFPSILLTGSSWRASPHPHPAPALPLSSPLWTEPPLSCCLPATYPADVGTAGAMQLCWVILGFLLFQGHNSQPATTQTSSSQGGLGSLSLTTEPVSSNPGYIPSSEANSPSHLSNTGTPGAGVPSSGRDGGTSRDTFQTVPPNSTTMSLSMREDVTILPSPTSETVLTVAAFGESGRRRRFWLMRKTPVGGGPLPLQSALLGCAGFHVFMQGWSWAGEPTLARGQQAESSPVQQRSGTHFAPGACLHSVISFIVILVVVVIVLVGVVSLRFKCRKSKESEDPQKPGSSGLSESCSTANGEKDSITLISMKNINMNNGKQSLSAEKI
ncbi:endothelial cell-specific chemotaxis regulator isoform X2 [Pongo pygmaeus]|uniref:endothelial cell-specific chemotaxis regulator isoform X2 n=1 Tax=Pongo pygmaeus TaxID=9600 RepID=UPI00300D8761